MDSRVRVEGVNSRWRRLARNRSWLGFFFISGRDYYHSLPTVTEKGHSEGNDKQLSLWLYSMLQRCGPYLRSMSFARLPLTPLTYALLYDAPKLKRLTLNNTNATSAVLLSEHVDALSEALPNLKELLICGMWEVGCQ